MADKKISDLTAIASQSTTDLYETSLNGAGSRKETRAQQKTYWDQYYPQTTGGVSGGDIVVYGASGVAIKSSAVNIDVSRNITNANSITLGTPLALTSGGTGKALTAANGAIPYTDADSFELLAPVASAGRVLQSGNLAAPTWSTPTYPSASGASGKILISDGTNNVYSTPTYPNASVTAGKVIISDGTNYVASTPTYPNASGAAGTILRSDGTNNIYSTSTFSDTYSASSLLYSNGANTVTGLATANAGVLRTNTSGVPSILAAPDTTGRALLGNSTSGVSWSSAGYPNTAAAADLIIRFDGTNFVSSAIKWTNTAGSTGSILRYSGAASGGVYSTATFADTYAASSILYSNGANTVQGLATANNSQLVTDSSGVPGWVSRASNASNDVLRGVGNFDLNPWQRGVTFTSAANNTKTADRFKWAQVGSGVVDVKKTADAPAIGSAGILVSNCLHVDVTTADASIAAGDAYRINYVVEGPDFLQLAQAAFTLSFWVKSTKTGIFSVGFSNSGQDRIYCAEYTVNTTNTWELKTITVPASPSAGTWLYTQGTVGLYILFYIAAGSDFYTTTGSWQTTGFGASANQVNGMDSTSNDFKLALIGLYHGSSAPVYVNPPVDDVLKFSQRYYETSVQFYSGAYFPSTNLNGLLSFTVPNGGTGQMYSTAVYKVTKNFIPTIRVNDGNGTIGSVYKGAQGKTAVTSNIGINSFINGTDDATSASAMYYHWEADAEF